MTARVAGNESPLMEKPAPLAAAWEIVTLDPPVLVKVSDWVLFAPIWTSPKAKLEGLGESAPCAIAAPVPERFSTTLALTWFEVVAKVTLPVKLALAGGANVTVTCAESPGCRVRGRARLLMAKPAPLKVVWLTVRALAPLFDMVTVVG